MQRKTRALAAVVVVMAGLAGCGCGGSSHRATEDVALCRFLLNNAKAQAQKFVPDADPATLTHWQGTYFNHDVDLNPKAHCSKVIVEPVRYADGSSG
jgi:ABC-type glycerol-3-phosphate transport system substrate-binding protein